MTKFRQHQYFIIDTFFKNVFVCYDRALERYRLCKLVLKSILAHNMSIWLWSPASLSMNVRHKVHKQAMKSNNKSTVEESCETKVCLQSLAGYFYSHCTLLCLINKWKIAVCAHELMGHRQDTCKLNCNCRTEPFKRFTKAITPQVCLCACRCQLAWR